MVIFNTGNKIFLRVFSVFGTLVLAVTMVVALMIIPWRKQSLQQIMYTQAITEARSIVQACSDAMLSRDFSFIVEHNIEVLEHNSGIRYVMFSPLRGKPLWIETKRWRLLENRDSRFVGYEDERDNYHFLTIERSGRVYHFVYPIRFSGLAWGWLHIGFSTRAYDQQINDMYRQLLMVAIASILIIVPIGYFFARWITLPVTTISRLATKVAQGDFSVKSEIIRNDEIGVLSESFNQMVLSLKESKEHLEHYNDELEQEVARRTRQLDELNRSLDHRVKKEVAQRQKQEELLIHQSRLAAMGEMIGAIAHQWRQPLNALGLVLQNIDLAYRSGKLDDAFMQRSQEKSQRLIGKMSTTIDDFRNFFKPNKHAERFYLGEVIDSVVELMDATLRNNNIELTVACDERLNIKGLQGEFSQVMLNLLNNAKDTLQERGIRAPKINVEVKQIHSGWIIVKVSDNAGGIAKDILHKIYDPYFTTRPEGTGIGLYMSKMIVENNMRGCLTAYNNGEGAHFVIEVPETDGY